ncbi:MAG: FAD-binding protein [Wenzhouxiangellaceae bacterium]|nr:FAD-binding protein [Wenzhouxiangellaceae bacterium]
MTDCCASKDNDRHYDIAVIGAGSAGFSAAITAAEQGARVLLVDQLDTHKSKTASGIDLASAFGN